MHASGIAGLSYREALFSSSPVRPRKRQEQEKRQGRKKEMKNKGDKQSVLVTRSPSASLHPPPAGAFPAFPTFRQMCPGISGGSGSSDLKWSAWTEAHTLPAVPHTQRRGQKRIQSCGVIQCLLEGVCGRLQHIYIQTMQRRSPLNAYVYVCVQSVIYIPSCM